MAQEFLDRLLSTPENRVQANCMICLENYNIPNTSTGIVEWEVRLPCGHCVGSSCIVTWLRANNSCPACRRTFFPARARPYLEHGIMDTGGTRLRRVPTGPGEPTGSRTGPVRVPTAPEVSEVPIDSLVRYLDSITRDLDGPRSVTRLHRELCVVFGELASTVIIVAVSMVSLMKLHLPDEDPHYIVVLLHARTLELIIRNYVDGMLRFLPPPDSDDGIIDDEEERREIQRWNTSPQMIADETDDLCNRYSQTFGGGNNYFISVIISTNSLLERRLGLRSPLLKAAIVVYMAAHLLGHQLSSGRIAYVMNINAGTFKTAYARAYPVRDDLIKPSTLQRINSVGMARALEAMGALNWPPLYDYLDART